MEFAIVMNVAVVRAGNQAVRQIISLTCLEAKVNEDH